MWFASTVVSQVTMWVYVPGQRDASYVVGLDITWITVQLGMLLCLLQNTGGVQIKGWVFFHVDVEGPAAVQWLNMDNVGIVVVNEGEISEKELEQNFDEMWKVNWF
jgi:hypothetical protein